ncbi:MAG TPA: XRE family transcriptional regulator [Pseudonocardiaceae bacterium]
MSEDWAAVSKAINERMTALGLRQGELVRRAHVSKAIVRELQHNVVQRRRSARTLEALSVALDWHPRHLLAVLNGRRPPEPGDPMGDEGEATPARLAAIEGRLSEIAERLDQISASLATVADHVAPRRR